ncbi:TonB-dependent siderophore receptor [Methylosinus sporium]|uniref:TonB-dependent siderophore receptor n=1 Tax=Methylosinus sporium TaxID=428 RepID=UPI00383BB886
MTRTTLSHGVSAYALGIGILTTAASAQEALPTIDIGSSSAGSRMTISSPASANQTGYARTTSSAATKTETKLLDTPQSVQIIPHEVIEDKQAISLQEIVQNVSGVQLENSSNPYDQFLIRGFSNGYGRINRNGLRMEGLIGATEAAFTDRVEIVKGPNSMLYGRIEPGGLVNVVTKRPQETFSANVSEQFGSWGLSRTVADATGPVDDEKSVLYRLMAVYDRADSFVNFDHRDNGAAALFLTFRPTERFEANVQFEHYQKKIASDGSWIPVDARTGRPFVLPRSFSMADPSKWSDFPTVVHRTIYAFDWTYKFDEDWKIVNRFNYVDNDENQNGLGFGGFDGVNIYRTPWMGNIKRAMLSANLDVTGKTTTGPFDHNLLVGADWFSYQDDLLNSPSSYDGLPLNIFAPAYGNVSAAWRLVADSGRSNVTWRTRSKNFGVYAQDQISFWDDRVHLLLGGRWDTADQHFATVYGDPFASCYPYCTGYPLKRYADTTPLSPRAGLVFKVDETTSLYGSYVRSSGTNNGYTSDGSVIPPERGLQWEVGAKKQFFDGRVMASVALFDLRKKNVLQADPLRPGVSVPVGEVTSRGVEFDISGQITDNLNVIASYTFDSVKITNDNNNGNVGKRYYGVAPNVANLWAKWDTAPGAAEGWEFGGGFYAMDNRWGDNANSWFMPGYIKFDAMGAYRTTLFGHGVTVRLNVKNLTDRRYFTNAGGWVPAAQYGQPRTFMGEIAFKW